MNKRGMTWESIAGWALFFLLVLAMTNLTSVIFGGTTYGAEKIRCQIDVFAGANLRVIGETLVNNNCPTYYTHIDTDEATISSGIETKPYVKKLPKLKGDDKTHLKAYYTKVNQVIADQLYGCWSQFGEGEIPVFSYQIDEPYCFICSQITFDKDVVDLVGDKTGPESLGKEYGLDSYLRTHRPLNQEVTYYEYLLDVAEDIYQAPYYHYSVDKEYAVVYQSQYSPDLLQALHGLPGSAVDCFLEGLGSFAGLKDNPCSGISSNVKRMFKTTKPTASISFVDFDKLPERCSRSVRKQK